VRDWGYVFDLLYGHSRCLQSGNRTFATRARTLDSNLNFFHTTLGRFFSRLLSRYLTSKWCALSGTFESACTGTCPAQRITFGIGDCHRGVVKRCLDVCHCDSDIASRFSFLVDLGHNSVSQILSKPNFFIHPTTINKAVGIAHRNQKPSGSSTCDRFNAFAACVWQPPKKSTRTALISIVPRKCLRSSPTANSFGESTRAQPEEQIPKLQLALSQVLNTLLTSNRLAWTLTCPSIRFSTLTANR